jgi:hypothetical protein
LVFLVFDPIPKGFRSLTDHGIMASRFGEIPWRIKRGLEESGNMTRRRVGAA